MLVPKPWLQEFVNLTGISDEDFAREMTFAGNKVENVKKVDGTVVYEFEITSNRPDTLSIIGIAREVSAVFGLPLKVPEVPKLKTSLEETPKLLINESHLCPTYSAVIIENVKIEPSSKSIQARLTQIKINPVNNVVDITNLLMHETGQPIHAFDANVIEGSLTLRSAKPLEKITPLDHLERELKGGEIIIEDEKKLIDLAGLMGGENSEITQKTTRIYLLVPIYDPISIRRASKNLKLRTDASNRFEKKLDLSQTELVLSQATNLIIKTAGGKQATTPVHKKSAASTQPISLSIEKLNKRIGITFSQDQVEKHLLKLGLKPDQKSWIIPPWRRDLADEVDLIEEIVRLHGLNKLPRTLPTGTIPVHKDALRRNWVRIIRERVASLGYTETYSSTVISKAIIESTLLKTDDHLNVLHPMSSEYEYMRLTVLENLIPLIEKNLEHTKEMNIFELGSVFEKYAREDQLPNQPMELGVISTTKSYSQLKGDIVDMCNYLGLTIECVPTDISLPFFHPYKCADLVYNNKQIGKIGALHPSLFPKEAPPIWGFIINCDDLINNATGTRTYPTVPQHTPITEDLTFSVPSKTYIGHLLDEIELSSKFIGIVTVKTIYEKEEGKKNVTFHIVYQHPERTMQDKEIAPIRKKIVKHLEKNFKLALVGKLA